MALTQIDGTQIQSGAITADNLGPVCGGSSGDIQYSDSGALAGAGGKLQTDVNGDLIKIRNVAYSWPSSQAVGSGYVLSNDGSGSLSWVAIAVVSPAGSNGSIQFKSGSSFFASSKLFWDNTNFRLGVGTSTPSAALHVGGVGVGAGQALIDATLEVAGDGGSLSQVSPGSYLYQATGAGSTHNFVGQASVVLTGGGIYDLALRSSGGVIVFASTSAGEQMRLDASGNLGVGTSGPSYRVDAAGDINTSSLYRVGGVALQSSDLSDFANLLLADGTHALTATLSIGGHSLTNLASPSSSTDAANKAYVDSVASGLSVRASVRALAASNITLSGVQTVDGVVLLAGDRVFVTAETSAVDNGIYVVAVGAWSRSTDLAVGSSAAGVFAFVEEGTLYAQSGWVCNDPVSAAIVGTASLGFTQFSGAGEITAGTGLSKSGNTLSLTSPVAVVNGGTGATSLAGRGVLLMNAGGTAATSLSGTSGLQVLRWNGSNWIAIQEASTDLSDSGTLIRNSTAATGDLSANYPNPTVAKIRGKTVSTTAPTISGQTLRFDSGSTQWVPALLASTDLSDTVSLQYQSTSGATLTNLTAANISAGTAGINITGNAANVTGTVPTTNGGTGNTLGRAVSATNIVGGAAGWIPCQTGTDVTGFITATATAGLVLTSVVSGGTPVWASPAISVTLKSSNYFATGTDGLILTDASVSGAFAVTLPSNGPSLVGHVYNIKKIDSSANTVTIAQAGSSINGASTLVLTIQYQSYQITSDGANWWTI